MAEICLTEWPKFSPVILGYISGWREKSYVIKTGKVYFIEDSISVYQDRRKRSFCKKQTKNQPFWTKVAVKHCV